MQPLNRELLWTSILVLLCCSLPSGCSSDTGPSSNTGPSSASEPATERHDAASLAAPTSSSNTTASPHLLIASDYQPPDQQGFVGSQACQKCHAEISETYAAHPMGQSIRPIDVAMESQRLIDQHAIVSDEPQSYVVAIEEDQLVHHERITDTEGQVLFNNEAVMEYVVGSGARAMAYLHRRDNLLFMSPLNWYSGAAKWDFAPGHSADDRRRFDRRVNDDCLSCHAGRVNVISRGSNQYEQTAFHEMAIGCENCHGAGADHIQFRNRVAAQANEQTTTANDDPIINPAQLDHQRQEAVCYQCHLHAPGRILRPGRSHFDFRPGDRLDDIWSMVIADDGVDAHGRTEAVSHVQQMHVSRCYIESSGKMGCVSCHNPHEKPADAMSVEYYRQKCLQCHTNESCANPAVLRQEKGDSCIQCHMPARQAKRISHVSQTDHRILRDVSVGEIAADPPPILDITADQYHFLWDTADRLSDWERKRAIGMTIWLKGSSIGRRPPPLVADMLEEVIAEVPNDGPVLTVLGAFSAEYQRIPKAREYFEAALQDPMVRESALTNLLTLYYVSSDWRQALDCANKILEFDKQNARIYALRADSLAHLGQFQDAIASAETALQLDPTMTPVRQWLEQAQQALRTN